MYRKMQSMMAETPVLENFGQNPATTRAFTLSGIWNQDDPEKLGYHSFHQILTVEHGVLLLYDGRFQQPLYRRSAAFIPADVPHRVFTMQDHQDAETFSIYFDKRYFPEAGETISIFPVTDLSGALIRELIQPPLQSIADDFGLQCVDLLAAVVHRDLNIPYQRLRLPVTDDKRILVAVAFIQKYYRQKMTLEDLASVVFLSSRQFSRLFVEKMGITPFEYLRMYRILSILPLVFDSEKKIIDIVYTSGYETVSSFYKDFSYLLGAPPKSFRAASLS